MGERESGRVGEGGEWVSGSVGVWVRAESGSVGERESGRGRGLSGVGFLLA